MGTMRGMSHVLDSLRRYQDPILAAVLSAVALVEIVIRNPLPIAVIGALLSTAPLLLRRTHPWTAAAIMVAGTMLVVIGSIRYTDLPVSIGVAGLIVVWTLLQRLDRASSWALTAIVGGALALTAYAGRDSNLIMVAATGAACVATLGLLTDLRRSHREVADTRADISQSEQERAAMAERARIAREMHDVVAHSISMVAVQAEAAPYTVPDLSDAARREFAEIAANARTSLAEMRRLLGVLRADVGDAAETAPQPGLGQLRDLIDRHGGAVDVDVVGESRQLGQAVDVSAYRIVQECLANARAHAPGSRVSIELAYRPEVLVLRVASDGPPVEPATGGHGLIGMRERALGLGGWFTAGPAPGGGFLVTAGLPT